MFYLVLGDDQSKPGDKDYSLGLFEDDRYIKCISGDKDNIENCADCIREKGLLQVKCEIVIVEKFETEAQAIEYATFLMLE